MSIHRTTAAVESTLPRTSFDLRASVILSLNVAGGLGTVWALKRQADIFFEDGLEVCQHSIRTSIDQLTPLAYFLAAAFVAPSAVFLCQVARTGRAQSAAAFLSTAWIALVAGWHHYLEVCEGQDALLADVFRVFCCTFAVVLRQVLLLQQVKILEDSCLSSLGVTRVQRVLKVALPVLLMLALATTVAPPIAQVLRTCLPVLLLLGIRLVCLPRILATWRTTSLTCGMREQLRRLVLIDGLGLTADCTALVAAGALSGAFWPLVEQPAGRVCRGLEQLQYLMECVQAVANTLSVALALRSLRQREALEGAALCRKVHVRLPLYPSLDLEPLMSNTDEAA